MMGIATARLATCALVVVTTLAGCSKDIQGQAVAARSEPAESSSTRSSTRPGGAAPGNCTSVSPPMTVIETSGSEPGLSIPQPSNWTRISKMDSQLIRYAMVDADLAANHFAPNAVVTLESVDAAGVEPQQVLDQQRKAVRAAGATDLRVTPTTLCGLAAERVTYSMPPQGDTIERSLQFLSVAGRFGEKMYSVTVTVQTTDPANPTYVTDSSAILDGFQVNPPGSG